MNTTITTESSTEEILDFIVGESNILSLTDRDLYVELIGRSDFEVVSMKCFTDPKNGDYLGGKQVKFHLFKTMIIGEEQSEGTIIKKYSGPSFKTY